jgi:Zn-dependent M28 family amino/carboxypeptidase
MSAGPSSLVLAEIEANLRRHVDVLAGIIGERHVPGRFGALEGAARYVEKTFTETGYQPRPHGFDCFGHEVRNVEATLPGRKRPNRVWVVGAHYDSIPGSPAANDNASAVAGLLEVARLLGRSQARDTIRFVAFVNEEPPYYKGPLMGSTVYATACRQRGDAIAGMVNFEMIGCFSDAPGSQRYPWPLDRRPWRWLLPRRGNFITFVGNPASWRLTRRCRRLFRRSVRFRSLWAAAPERMVGIGMSDHWSFWRQGYSAVMVTDTAFFRYPHYHTARDTPEKLNYPAMAKVVAGLTGMIGRLAAARR